MKYTIIYFSENLLFCLYDCGHISWSSSTDWIYGDVTWLTLCDTLGLDW